MKRIEKLKKFLEEYFYSMVRKCFYIPQSFYKLSRENADFFITGIYHGDDEEEAPRIIYTADGVVVVLNPKWDYIDILGLESSEIEYLKGKGYHEDR